VWSNTTWATVRWAHIAAAFANGFVLYRADDISALDPSRYFIFPLLFVTGVWLWIGRRRRHSDVRRRRARRIVAR
jgi:hypothetical protein